MSNQNAATNCASPGSSNTTTYTYNGAGLRIGEETHTATYTFTWNTLPSTPELLADGSFYYLYGPGSTSFEQIAQGSGSTTYLASDTQGVRFVINADGTQNGTLAYDSYGNTTSGSGSSFGFAGAYTDPDGLIYLINRYYDPATGEFLSVDPDVAETGQPYAYTDDDPINAIDPDGLDCGIFSVVCGAYDSAAGGVKTAAKDTGSFVYQHASTLSTIASGLATVAYLSCAVTEGVGCGVGLLLSTASTGLAGVNTYRACFGGAGGCATAATSLGLSVVATGAGIGLQNAAEGGLANVFNAYSRDIYLARQAGVIGAGLNGLSTLYSLLSDYAFGCG